MIYQDKIFLILILIFVSCKLFAQVNVEKYKSVKETEDFYLMLGINFSAQTGNTDIQEIGLESRVGYRENKNFFFIVGQGEYGWNSGREFSNEALLHLRFIREINSLVSLEAFEQINYDKSIFLNFRNLIGTGLRFRFLQDTTVNLDFGTSYMFEYEKLDRKKVINHTLEAFHHRWNNYISYAHHLSSFLRISSVIYIQPRFDNMKDIRILGENHLKIDLSKNTSLSISLNLRFDSEPPETIKKLDTSTKIGFSITF